MSETPQGAGPGPGEGGSLVERGMRLFTEVRPGEGPTALLMLANVFLILCAYYLVKPLREGWLAVSGIEGLTKMELKAYSSFGQGVVLIGVTAAYARLVGRLPRVRLISWTTLFCISNLLVFWVLQPDFFFENLPISGIVFYLWVGIFGVFVVAQFWAFAADLYDDEQGRRLIPLIAIGATSGAVLGSWISQSIAADAWLPSEYALLVAIAPLLASIGLTRAASRRAPSPALAAAPAAAPEDEAPDPEREGALSLVLGSPFLLAVAVVTLILNWVNTNGENVLFAVVQQVLEAEAAESGVASSLRFVRDGTTGFYGSFFFWVNLTALLLQAFLASRLLRYGGFGAIFLLLPVIALLTYTSMWIVPMLGVIKVMKVAENATDYSISNTSRHVLWLPMDSGVVYRAKPTIDSLFVRLGDGLAALTVLVGTHVIALEVGGYLATNVALVLIWLVLGVWIVRRHRRLVEARGPDDLA